MCFFSFFRNKRNYREQINTSNQKKEWVIESFSDFNDLISQINSIKNKKDYENNKIVIKKKVYFPNKTIDTPINLSNCIFEEVVNFANTTFSDIVIVTSIFNKSANFNNCTFKGEETNFTFTKFNGDTQFQNANFSSKITRFEKTEFNNKTLFIKADFYNEVSIGATFTDNVHFSEAKFLGDRIKFNGSTFNKKVRFHHCEFYNWVKFENTTFNKLVDFYRAKFLAPQQFHLTDFMDRVIFSDAVFEKEAQFIHCKADINSIINFHSTTFNKGLDISRSNFNICKVSFWDIKINGLNKALSSELYKNNFGDYEYLPSVPKKLRESMRFIKNNFYAENNRIEGLDFYKEEMKIYEKELKSVDWQNRFLLFLHKNSNNFETDWIMGVLFTILVGLITFSFIMISLILSTPPELEITDKFQDFLYNFGQIINITQWSNITIYEVPIKGWEYAILFIGRIFISYGYYQTIQAFRKYGKS